MNNSISTVELIAKLKEGDIRAFKNVYIFYFDRTLATALSIVKDKAWAEDIVQEVFVSVWNNKSKLNCSTDIWYYIYVLTKNASISKLRLIQKDQHLINKLYDGLHVQYVLQEDMKSDIEVENMLVSIKSKLTQQQRLIFEMCREEGLTYSQVALKLNISKNTVKNHMINSLKIFRALLRRDSILLIFYFFL